MTGVGSWEMASELNFCTLGWRNPFWPVSGRLKRSNGKTVTKDGPEGSRGGEEKGTESPPTSAGSRPDRQETGTSPHFPLPPYPSPVRPRCHAPMDRHTAN